MPYLVDGNNVQYAMRKAGLDMARSLLCNLMDTLARQDRVCVVFDGPQPPHGLLQQLSHENVEMIFSEHRKADELILDRIRHDSAPRRLVVVSSDHEIRQLAHQRQCRMLKSDEFVQLLLDVDQAPPPPKRVEPAGKYQGLSGSETQAWMHEFHLDEDENDNDQ